MRNSRFDGTIIWRRCETSLLRARSLFEFAALLMIATANDQQPWGSQLAL